MYICVFVCMYVCVYEVTGLCLLFHPLCVCVCVCVCVREREIEREREREGSYYAVWALQSSYEDEAGLEIGEMPGGGGAGL